MGPRPQEHSPRRAKLLVILIAIIVSVVGIVFDRMLLHAGVPRNFLIVLSNTLTGIVAGGFFWQAMRRELDHRDFVSRRLRIIADMNHHIRNALQVISLYSYRGQDEKNIKVVNEAVNRIEWALQEVLPGNVASPPLTGPPLARKP
ncbi:MAG TPA: hypothetical protein VFQ00_02740 [Terriglobales bacterium]|nr:hypothetical protein [Terriglobales bacterium]